MLSETVLFREVQRFRQWWLWLIVLSAPGVCVYALIQQMVFDEPFGDEPVSDAGLIVITIAFGLTLPLLFYVINLTTEVRRDGLYVRYFPFHPRFHRIAFDTISRYEARTYSPLKEFGGWGIRWGKASKAYNVSGNHGVQLEFKNGKKLLIGSQRADEFARAMETAIKASLRIGP